MKGITKAIMRTPHMVSAKVGMAKKSNDPEFDDLQRRFALLEEALEKVIKDTKTFTEGVANLFTATENWSTHFNLIFSPLAGELDILGKYPDATSASRHVSELQAAMQDLRVAILPELELIQSRISGPCKELQGVMKIVRKNITKRDHKLVDYDRFNNSLTKLREKKEKSLNDEKNLFKLEQDFEQASTDYESHNATMKTELPHFMALATQFIDPLFHSFFYMELNIFYLMLEKMQEFANGKYELAPTINDITDGYESRRTDAKEQIEALQINKRLVSTAKLMQARRQDSSLPATGSALTRNSSVATSTRSTSGGHAPPPPPPALASTSSVSNSPFMKKPPPPPPALSSSTSSVSNSPFLKKPPPPPPVASSKPTMRKSFGGAVPTPTHPSGAPPPYSPPASGSGGVIGKRPPPPIPTNKPKPHKAPTPQPVYVIALYDFEAQAEGDLSFIAGDHIEIVKRSQDAQDWWTGRLNGAEGVFPGNYVQDV